MTDEPQQQPAARRRPLVSQLLELTRHSAIYGIGGLMSRFLAVLMLPLYTSYVSTKDYGRIELLMATMAVAVVVIRGGANFGFIRFYFLEKEADYRRRLIRTVFWAQMTYSTLVLALCVLFASPLAGLLGVRYAPHSHLQGSGTSLVIATAVLLWANVNYAQMTNLFRAEKRSVAFSIATVANILITVGFTVILVVVYHKGPLGIIVGNLSGTLVVYVALLAYRREQLGLQFDLKLLRTMNRFGIPLMAAALAIWVTNFGDRLMLSKLLHGTVPAHPARAVLARLQDRLGDGAPLHRLPDRLARIRVLDRGRGRGEARLLLRPHVPHVPRRLDRGRAEPLRAVARALPRAEARATGRRRMRSRRSRFRTSSSPASSSSPSRPAASARRSSTGSQRPRPRSSTSGSTSG